MTRSTECQHDPYRSASPCLPKGDAARLSRTGGLVGGDDLRRHGLNLHGLFIREEGQARQLTRLGCLSHVFLSGEDAMIVGRDPRGVQARYGINQE